MESGTHEVLNNTPGIIRLAKSPGMREEIHSPVFHFLHISIVVNNGFTLHHDRQAPGQRHALPDLGTLRPDRLGQQIKILRSAQDHTPVFPVLGNHGKHLRGKVPGHVGAEPVLQLVHDHNHPFVRVLVIGQLAPMGQRFILVHIFCVGNTLCKGILIMQLHGVLEECSTLSVTLAPSKYYKPLGSKEVRFPVIEIIDILLGSIHEDFKQRRTLHRRADAAPVHPVTFPVPAVVPKETVQVKDQQNSKEKNHRPFQKLEQHLTHGSKGCNQCRTHKIPPVCITNFLPTVRIHTAVFSICNTEMKILYYKSPAEPDMLQRICNTVIRAEALPRSSG